MTTTYRVKITYQDPAEVYYLTADNAGSEDPAEAVTFRSIGAALSAVAGTDFDSDEDEELTEAFARRRVALTIEPVTEG